MPIKQGLKTALNKMREMSVDGNSIYHQYVPIIEDNTDISVLSSPVLQYTPVMNEFLSSLLQRIVYTSFESKYFNNPLQQLEGDSIPLGYEGQEIFINPAKGRKYNVNDFAGLLQKYEADVKVQYHNVNMELQYPVTVSRHKLKQAFVSWDTLDRFVLELANSLYNGAHIDEFRFTKNIVSEAYLKNMAQIYSIKAPNTEALAKEFITKVRTLFLNFQLPSTNYNAWSKVGGYGRPITTYTEKDDIVFLIRNDLLSYIDVNVLASSFNIDKSDLLGRIIPIDNFDIYNDDGVKIFDGKDIYGFIGDKRWFRIKRQDMFLDEFYNANNKTWQYYLNLDKLYNFSLFANGVILALSEPNIPIASLSFKDTTMDINVGDNSIVTVDVNPITANSPNISFSSSDTDIFTMQQNETNNRQVTITGVKAGTATLTATAGNVNATMEINVK